MGPEPCPITATCLASMDLIACSRKRLSDSTRPLCRWTGRRHGQREVPPGALRATAAERKEVFWSSMGASCSSFSQICRRVGDQGGSARECAIHNNNNKMAGSDGGKGCATREGVAPNWNVRYDKSDMSREGVSLEGSGDDGKGCGKFVYAERDLPRRDPRLQW